MRCSLLALLKRPVLVLLFVSAASATAQVGVNTPQQGTFSQTSSQSGPTTPPPSEQGQSYSVPLLRASSHAVVLDVVVTDAHNHPILGLRKSNFSVLEDGKLQNISFFEAHDTTASVQALPRTVIVIDELNTHFSDLAYVRYSVQKLLKRDGGKLLQPTSMMVLSDEGLEMLADYTQDPAVLETTLEHLPPRIPIRLFQGIYGAEERVNMSLQALQAIALANQSSDRRQVVVWISPGLPVFSRAVLSQRDEERLSASLRALSKDLLQGRVTLYTVDPRGVGHINYADRLANGTSLADLSKPSKVTFADAALQVIAVQTGGQAFYGRNDVDAEVATSISDGVSFYTVSYYPSDRNFDGNFRRITVDLDQPHLTIRSREGYYALPEPPPPTFEEVAARVEEALVSQLTYGSIPTIQGGSVVWSSPSQGRFDFLIPGQSVNWETLPDGKMHCTLVVGAADFPPPDALDMAGPEGAKSAASKMTTPLRPGMPGTAATPTAHSVLHEYTITFPADKAAALAHGNFRISIDLPLEEPPQRVRFVVSDLATGRIGSTDITSFPAPSPGGPPPQHKD